MKTMNHAQYQTSLHSKSKAALRFILTDTQEVLEANPNGENAGYYMDEQHYAAMELTSRAKIEKRFNLTGELDKAREVCEPFPRSRAAA